MEYLSVYNERREKLNKKVARGEKLLDGEHILISIIFIEINEGKFLMQKTSKEKGSKYSSTGGHVLENENSKDAIIREVKEELGIDISKDSLVVLGGITLGIPIFDVYYLKKDIDINKLSLQKDEVESVSYLNKKEISKLIREENITKSHGIIFDKFIK